MNKETIRFVEQLASFIKKLSKDKDTTEEVNAYMQGYSDALKNLGELLDVS